MRTRSKLSILLSILLCCTMLAGLLPTVAFAEDSTIVSSENGAGTSSENGADTSSKNGADTSSKNGADTSSKNGADTTSENGADTTSENSADTSPEKGTAAPLAAPPAAPSVAWIGETGYPTLEAAVNAAASGDTIVLGEGKFTLYKKGAHTKGKDLTFVGQGADKTAWGIGATLPDPAYFGTEYNGDYSFDGSGTITFRNMTLQSGSAD